jgi:hypothetical protein
MLLMFQACMAGILFAKFTKPSMRAETFMFSKVANLIGTKSLVTALESYAFFGLLITDMDIVTNNTSNFTAIVLIKSTNNLTSRF